ncbi:MAG: tetratricopeptide repeat protein [Verrucomicrobiota bacterium]|nr:tetratricopeptide repeat protein [Verrucomicrobiota bacterium]
MVAARELRGWVVPYGLVMGGGDWRVSGVPEASQLADWPILRFDRVQGVVVLSTVEPIDAVGFGLPVAPVAERPGRGERLWVAARAEAGERGELGPLQWIAAERAARPEGGMIPGDRIRIRLMARPVLSPGAVVAVPGGGFASVERGVAGREDLFDCVVWPESADRLFLPGARFSELETRLAPTEQEALWATAELNLAADQSEAAWSLLSAARDLGPECWQIALLGAMAAERTQRDSGPWIERAIALAPSRQEVQSVAFRLAELSNRAELRAKWLSLFERAGAIGPDLTLLKARSEMDSGDWDRALELLSDATLRETIPADALYWVGRCFQAMGRREHAFDAFLTATQSGPAKAEYLDALSASALEVGRAELAAEAGRRAIAVDPEFAPAYHHLGLALVQLQQPLFAIEIFRRGIALNPKDLASMTNLGKLLVWMGSYEEAKSVLERALEQSPENPLAWIHLAEVYMKEDDLAAARRAAEQAAFVAPNDPDAWFTLSRVVYRAGRTEDAIPVLEKALDLEPTRPGFWVERVRWERDFRDAERVLNVIARARGTLPGDPWLVATEGEALMELGRLKEAEELLRRGVDRNPKAGGLWKGLAQCLRRAGDLDGAEAVLEGALRRVDDTGVIAGELGFLRGLRSVLARARRFREDYPGATWDRHMEERARRLLLGKREELSAYFSEVAQQNPRDPYIGWFIAQAHWDRGALVEAESGFLELVQDKVEDDVSHLFALESLVDLLRRKGELARAEELTESLLIPSNPYCEIGYVVAGTAKVNTGRPQAAREAIAPGLELFPDSYPLQMIEATSLVQLEAWDEAGPLLERMLGRAPRDPDLNFLAGICQLQRGGFAEAVHHFEWVLQLEPQRVQAAELLEQIKSRLERRGE